ncbi:unnamed protein product, partial [Tetraodon nigroviridis]
RSCAGCGGDICERFLLFSMERYWHTRCLRCSCCQARLGDLGPSCYSRGGLILCRSDYVRLFGPRRRLQRLQPVHPSQRDGDEGTRKRLPPEGVCVCVCVCVFVCVRTACRVSLLLLLLSASAAPPAGSGWYQETASTTPTAPSSVSRTHPAPPPPAGPPQDGPE